MNRALSASVAAGSPDPSHPLSCPSPLAMLDRKAGAAYPGCGSNRAEVLGAVWK
jgi:hypothetical protein